MGGTCCRTQEQEPEIANVPIKQVDHDATVPINEEQSMTKTATDDLLKPTPNPNPDDMPHQEVARSCQSPPTIVNSLVLATLKKLGPYQHSDKVTQVATVLPAHVSNIHFHTLSPRNSRTERFTLEAG